MAPNENNEFENDLHLGTGGQDQLFGDAAGTLSGSARGGNDTIIGAADRDVVRGDASALEGHARGGDDLIIGGPGSSTFGDVLEGDASTLTDEARGGDDTLYGGEGFLNFLFGDGGLSGSAQGGDDLIIGGPSHNYLIGDGYEVADRSRGGDDWLLAAEGSALMTGDAFLRLAAEAWGGDDRLWGGADSDSLSGDAAFYLDGRGGDDTLNGGGGDDYLTGDASELAATARGGRDAFVFEGVFGNDRVFDFRQGEDRLVFGLTGVSHLGDLAIAAADGNTVIGAEGFGSVTLVGFTGSLGEADLVFR